MGFAPPFARMKQIVREHFKKEGAPQPSIYSAPPVAAEEPVPEVVEAAPPSPPPPEVLEEVADDEVEVLESEGAEDSEETSTLPPDYKLAAMRRPDLDILAQHHGIVDPHIYETKNTLIAAIKLAASPH